MAAQAWTRYKLQRKLFAIGEDCGDDHLLARPFRALDLPIKV